MDHASAIQTVQRKASAVWAPTTISLMDGSLWKTTGNSPIYRLYLVLHYAQHTKVEIRFKKMAKFGSSKTSLSLQ